MRSPCYYRYIYILIKSTNYSPRLKAKEIWSLRLFHLSFIVIFIVCENIDLLNNKHQK